MATACTKTVKSSLLYDVLLDKPLTQKELEAYLFYYQESNFKDPF